MLSAMVSGQGRTFIGVLDHIVRHARHQLVLIVVYGNDAGQAEQNQNSCTPDKHEARQHHDSDRRRRNEDNNGGGNSGQPCDRIAPRTTAAFVARFGVRNGNSNNRI